MDSANIFWTYWYYNIPNYLLAAVMYTLIGRLLLGLFVPPTWNNYIWRAFRRLTDPLLAGVRMITPLAVHSAFLPPLAVVWVMILRLLFTLVMLNLGLTPPLETALSAIATGFVG